MGKTISINYPNIPEGAPVEINGLGVFANGSETEVDDQQIELWQLQHPDMELCLTFPQEFPEANKTQAESAGEVERAITERQDARTPEQVAAEEQQGVRLQQTGDIRADPVASESKTKAKGKGDK